MFWYFHKGLEPHSQRAHAGHTQGDALKGTVTLRQRDSMAQERLPIAALPIAALPIAALPPWLLERVR